MKKIILLSSTVALMAIGGTGCMSQAALVGALAKDPAAASVSLTTIYGNLKVVRAGAQPGTTTTIAPDGTLTVSQFPPAK